MEFLCVLWIGKYIVVMDTLQSVWFLVSFLFNTTFLKFVSHLGNVQVLERLFCKTRHFKTCCADSFLLEPDVFNFWFQHIPENSKILVQNHFMRVNHRIVQHFLSKMVDWVSENDEYTQDEEVYHKWSTWGDLIQELFEIMICVCVQVFTIVDDYPILENLLVREYPS